MSQHVFRTTKGFASDRGNIVSDLGTIEQFITDHFNGVPIDKNLAVVVQWVSIYSTTDSVYEIVESCQDCGRLPGRCRMEGDQFYGYFCHDCWSIVCAKARETKRNSCQTCHVAPGEPRIDQGLPAGDHCEDCWQEMLQTCRLQSW